MALCVRFLRGCRVGGRIMPRRDRACRRARGRQGRCAPLTRWPEAGPSLTAAARAGTGRAQVGTEGWRRSNRRMERNRQSSGCRHLADGTQRGDFWGRLPALPLTTRYRECRKRKRAAARYRADCRCVLGLIIVRARSVTGDAIALLGSAESAGGDEGSEALVEGGGADAAASCVCGNRRVRSRS